MFNVDIKTVHNTLVNEKGEFSYKQVELRCLFGPNANKLFTLIRNRHIYQLINFARKNFRKRDVYLW